MKIRLSVGDMHESRMLAQDTVALLEHMGKSPRLENKRQGRLDANWSGFMAEFAFARAFDLPAPKMNIVSDGGVDFWIDGVAIDVKLTGTGKLIFDSLDAFKAHVAVLARVCDEPDCIEFLGWTGKTFFGEACYSHDFGYGERLVMDAEDLHNMGRLWVKITERRFK